RELMGIASVQVGGPYNGTTPADTPSRRALFVCRPARADTREEERCASSILAHLTRRAFRRAVGADEVAPIMGFYREGRAKGSFDGGIQRALARVLVDP